MPRKAFIVNALGRSAQEAFNESVLRALNEHGTDKNTGTIAEKIQFEIISETVNGALHMITASPRVAEPVREKIITGLKTSPFDKTWVAKAMLATHDYRVEDEYGPAGCIRTGPEHYMFFGWAPVKESIPKKA